MRLTAKQLKRLQAHQQFSQSDLEYLINKGYIFKEILDIWNRDAKMGKKPCSPFNFFALCNTVQI